MKCTQIHNLLYQNSENVSFLLLEICLKKEFCLRVPGQTLPGLVAMSAASDLKGYKNVGLPHLYMHKWAPQPHPVDVQHPLILIAWNYHEHFSDDLCKETTHASCYDNLAYKAEKLC